MFAARYANIAKQFLYSLRGCLSVRRDGTLNGISPCMYISLLCFYLLFGDEYWQFCQLNKSLHDRTITMSLCNEYFLRNCLLYGRRNGTFGTFFIPGLKTVYMVGGTGCLPGRDVCQDDFTRDNFQTQHNNVTAKPDGVFL